VGTFAKKVSCLRDTYKRAQNLPYSIQMKQINAFYLKRSKSLREILFELDALKIKRGDCPEMRDTSTLNLVEEKKNLINNVNDKEITQCT